MRNTTSLLTLGTLLFLAASGARADLRDNLVAYYPLDETTGITAFDQIAENHGTLSGNLDGDEWVTGKIGGGLQFTRTGRDGNFFDPPYINGWIEADSLLDGIGESGVLNDTDSYTFSVWAQLTPQGTTPWGHAIWGANTVATTNGNVCRIGANKTADGVFTRTDHTFGANTVDWADEGFHLITLTFDPAGNADYYVDGALAISKLDDTGLDREKAWSTAGLFHFGMEMEGNKATDGWNGMLDELAIWNRELSAAEISELYNGGDGMSLGADEFDPNINGDDIYDDKDLNLLLSDFDAGDTDPSATPYGQADLDALLAVFGDSASGSASPVPEPTSMILMLFGLIGLAGWRQRK